MMELPFTKYEANGNALILVDARSRFIDDPAALARTLCEPHTAIGGDGLLLLLRGADDLPLMRMFNPDGTEDFCGNGLLCTVSFLHEAGESRTGMVTLRSPQGLHEGRQKPTGRHGLSVAVDLVKPRFEPEGVPVRLPGRRVIEAPLEVEGRTFPISCVNVGTTHTVIFGDQDVPDGVFREISPLIETHELFPQRTSVLWCRIEGRDKIWMRIWERGVGETFACGTGACAAVAIAASTGRTARRATVASRGGKAHVDWPAARPIRLSSPVRRVYSGAYLPS
jgi:diaminopimelate epimerase